MGRVCAVIEIDGGLYYMACVVFGVKIVADGRERMGKTQIIYHVFITSLSGI